MKKVMVFVLNLMVGLILSIILGLGLMVKKAFSHVRKQLNACEKRGATCLSKAQALQSAWTRQVMTQVKKSSFQLKTSLDHSKEQGITCVKEMQKKQAAQWMNVQSMMKEFFFQIYQQLNVFVQKGAIYMSKMTSLLLGLVTGVALTLMFHSNPVDVSALVSPALEANVNATEETDAVSDFPEVFDTLFMTSTTVELPSIEETQTPVVAETQADAVLSSTEPVEEVIQNETMTNSEVKSTEKVATTSKEVVKPSNEVITPSKETVEAQTKPVKNPIQTDEEATGKPDVQPEGTVDQPSKNPSSEQSEVIETPETPKEPVIMPGETVVGGLIINDSLVEEMVPNGGILIYPSEVE